MHIDMIQSDVDLCMGRTNAISLKFRNTKWLLKTTKKASHVPSVINFIKLPIFYGPGIDWIYIYVRNSYILCFQRYTYTTVFVTAVRLPLWIDNKSNYKTQNEMINIAVFFWKRFFFTLCVLKWTNPIFITFASFFIQALACTRYGDDGMVAAGLRYVCILNEANTWLCSLYIRHGIVPFRWRVSLV